MGGITTNLRPVNYVCVRLNLFGNLVTFIGLKIFRNLDTHCSKYMYTNLGDVVHKIYKYGSGEKMAASVNSLKAWLIF